jgi:hypothetical protein
MEWKEIQIEPKSGEVNQFPQFRECRYIPELIIVRTRNEVEGDTDGGKDW